MQNFCFRQLSMQILWRRRYGRVVDLKLPTTVNTRPWRDCDKPKSLISQPSLKIKGSRTVGQKKRGKMKKLKQSLNLFTWRFVCFNFNQSAKFFFSKVCHLSVRFVPLEDWIFMKQDKFLK